MVLTNLTLADYSWRNTETHCVADVTMFAVQEWAHGPALKEEQDHHQGLHAQQGQDGQFPVHSLRPTWRSSEQLLVRAGSAVRID